LVATAIVEAVTVTEITRRWLVKGAIAEGALEEGTPWV
jgi:hypothetical protein